MKKIFFFSLLGLFLAGCTKETGKNPGSEETDVTNYLSVSLVAANRAGTRVDINNDGNDDFDDGKPEENAVSRIRFYFFDNKDNKEKAFPVWKGTGDATASYIDWYPTAADFQDGNKDETVVKIANTTLSLNLTSEGGKPASVLAVINPCASVLALANPDLETLRKAIYDFNTGLTDKNFVMSNSVYVEDDGETVYSTALKEENFATTLEEFQEEPNKVVKIYVERVVARLDLEVKLTEDEDLTKTVKSPVYSVSKDYTIDGEASQKVFVKFLGWNVTSTPDKSYLVKEIDPNWQSEDLFGEDSNEIWNTDDYHRSFWAVNPPAGQFDYQYGTFTKESKDEEGNPLEDNHFPADALTIPAAGPVYLHENAGAAEGDQPQPTKVIIAAQLLNEKGEPFEIAEWAYRKYTLKNLKTVFANEVLRLYKKDGASYVKIEPKELDFKTAQELETGENDYYVYPVLASGVDKDGYWYLKVDGIEGEESDKVKEGEDNKNFTLLTSQQANDYLRDRINHVMVWKGGNTYYYLNIRHLGIDESKPGYWGVVRNHLYKVNISKLEGLGTPVYNPDEIIHPEQPEGDESILSAEVKILQWRIVSQDYDLTWK